MRRTEHELLVRNQNMHVLRGVWYKRWKAIRHVCRSIFLLPNFPSHNMVHKQMITKRNIPEVFAPCYLFFSPC